MSEQVEERVHCTWCESWATTTVQVRYMATPVVACCGACFDAAARVYPQVSETEQNLRTVALETWERLQELGYVLAPFDEWSAPLLAAGEQVSEDGEVVSADGTSIGARCDMCGGMACYRADCDEQRRAEQAYATERRLTADLVHIRRDLRTMVARDDDGNGWNADNVSYLLDLEALTTELLRRAQVSS